MKITKRPIKAAEDAEQYEDDIKEIGQEFTSENTSINSGKLPAIFNLVHFEPETVNLDYGGGRFDNAAEYLAQFDVINLVYDPYNRSPKHNSEVIRLVKEHGGADTATCSNVLNVIKEPEVRRNVLQNIKKLVKPSGKVYITVYEGTGKGNEGPTKAGYQLNRKTADYLDEIREVFPDAQKKGKLIVAHAGQGSVTSAKQYYGGAYDIDPYQYFSTDELVGFGDECANDITNALKNIDPEHPQVQMRDVYIVDYSRVVLEFDVDNEFDIGAQFNVDMRRIRKPSDINKYKDIVVDEAIREYKSAVGYNDRIESAYEPVRFNPPEPEQPDELQFTAGTDVIIEGDIVVKDNGLWIWTDEAAAFGNKPYTELDQSDEYVISIPTWLLAEMVSDLISEYVPDIPGKYHISAQVNAIFKVTGLVWREYDEPDDIIEDSLDFTLDPAASRVIDIDIE